METAGRASDCVTGMCSLSENTGDLGCCCVSYADTPWQLFRVEARCWGAKAPVRRRQVIVCTVRVPPLPRTPKFQRPRELSSEQFPREAATVNSLHSRVALPFYTCTSYYFLSLMFSLYSHSVALLTVPAFPSPFLYFSWLLF